jgi:glycosyltransferase involved in cell wall biosynthesis
MNMFSMNTISMNIMEIGFVIPGDLHTLTGGYAYDREVIAHLTDRGVTMHHIALPSSFPFPTDEDERESALLLNAIPKHIPLLIDGLAYGGFSQSLLDTLKQRCVVALVHHPLCAETGLDVNTAQRLKTSEKRALDAAGHIIVTSDATRNGVIHDFEIAPSRITVAEPGVKRVAFTTIRTPAQQLLAVGTVIPRKGYDVLIEALHALREVPWTLDIVGATDRCPHTYTQLQNRVEALGLSSRIFFKGVLTPEQVEEAYQTADVFILASHLEGYGMVLTEALAHGLPVISTRTGAATDPRYAETLQLVDSGDVAGLRDAICLFLRDDETCVRAAEKSRRIATHLPTWEDTAEVIVSVFSSLSQDT